MVDTKKLKEFLKKAKTNTYASGNQPQKREDEADFFRFSSADFEGFEYIDVYFGGKKFSGQEIVKQNGIIIWSMVYYGGIVKDILTEDTLYNRYLKKLLSTTDEIPARGKDGQIEKNGDAKVIYHNPNSDNKDIAHFRGREFIVYNGETVYELFYAGGMIEG